MRTLSLVAAALFWAAIPAAAAEPMVVASIKPVHSLVAGVMQGVGEPRLLVAGAGDPHGHSLRPSDAAALQEADVVFWIGEGLESFLVRPLQTIPRQARIVELAQTEGLVLLEPRPGGAWEDLSAAHGETGGTARYDGHLWLDPLNAKLLVGRIAAVLSEADPANATAYAGNAGRLQSRLDELDRELTATLAPVRDLPFVVFHDAYRYFEARYGLNAVASVLVSPEQPPGARRLREVRATMLERRVRCVFREPEFDPALLATLTEGTGVRTGELDDLGATVPDGPELYFTVLRDLGQSLRTCLAASS